MALIDKGDARPPSFEEQLRAAEEEAGVPADEEFYGQSDETPIEIGEEMAPRLVEAEAEAETPEPEPEVEAVEEPPDKLDELNKKLGQLLNENAEFRKENEALRQQFQQPQEQPQQQFPVTQETIGYLDQLAAEDPAQAVQLAIQSGQPILYDRALRAWYDQDYVAANRFERQVEYQQLEQRLGAQIQPQIQGAQQLAQTNELEKALDAVQGRHEDFAQVIGSLDESRIAEIVQGGLPVEILQGLAGDQNAKERVVETIYRWVKAEQAGVFSQASEEVAQAAAAETKQAKLDATVASATTTTPDSVPETESERMVREWSSRPSLREGWTGRDSRQRLGR